MKVNSYINSYSNAEIKEKLNMQTDEVYKMAQHGIVKIRFHDIQTAKKFKEQGLILYLPDQKKRNDQGRRKAARKVSTERE